MQPEGTGWITVREATQILGVGRHQVNNLIRQKNLTHFDPEPGKVGSPRYVQREEIEQLAREKDRMLRQFAREQQRQKQAKLAPWFLPRPDDELISIKEAAHILEVRGREVNKLIEIGRLCSLRAATGKQGSPHRLLKRQVEALSHNTKRQKRREAYFKSSHSGLTPEQKAECALEEPIAPWLTTNQVKNWLGVSEGTVAYYRRAGRIYAYKRPRPRVSGNAGVWMHSKADLKAMLNDPQFQKRRAAWDKAQETRDLKSWEWIARVNDWDNPQHEWDYQASPGPIW